MMTPGAAQRTVSLLADRVGGAVVDALRACAAAFDRFRLLWRDIGQLVGAARADRTSGILQPLKEGYAPQRFFSGGRRHGGHAPTARQQLAPTGFWAHSNGQQRL